MSSHKPPPCWMSGVLWRSPTEYRAKSGIQIALLHRKSMVALTAVNLLARAGKDVQGRDRGQGRGLGRSMLPVDLQHLPVRVVIFHNGVPPSLAARDLPLLHDVPSILYRLAGLPPLPMAVPTTTAPQARRRGVDLQCPQRNLHRLPSQSQPTRRWKISSTRSPMQKRTLQKKSRLRRPLRKRPQRRRRRSRSVKKSGGHMAKKSRRRYMRTP